MLANFENCFRYIIKQQHFYTIENNIVLSSEIYYIQKMVYSYKKNEVIHIYMDTNKASAKNVALLHSFYQ